MSTGSVICVIAIFLVCAIYSREIPLSDDNNRLYSVLASGQGLYANDSKVFVLNATNFRSSVYNTKNSWLVEFYNSWCGHCQRFAPVWKSFAADIYGWKSVVKIAAIDCAADDNNPLCREYEIMHYPALKFFPAGANIGHMGVEIEKHENANELRHSILEILKKEQIEGRGSSWPNVTPYRSNDVQNLWKYAPDSVQFTILIFEDTDSDVATQVILDLNHVKDVQIRTVLNQNEALVKLIGVLKFPSIVVLQRDLAVNHLKIIENSREAFREAIKSFLKSRNIIVAEDDINDFKKPVLNEPAEMQGVGVRHLDDVVYQVDLENTIQYSLKNEIPIHKLITGDALQALKNYLNVLAKYFPFGETGVKFLKKLHEKVEDIFEIKGEQFYKYVEQFESELKPVFMSTDGWIGCKGSRPRYRGYPCGLWTTFHMLTTNAVIEEGHKKTFDRLEVLNAVLGYVTYFFGCHDCSQHFQEMARKSMYANVTGPDESILWLWSAHNQANKRLAGDMTEDPQHPKVQFPTRESCPACRSSDGRWVKKQVLIFLKQMYSKKNISHMK
ncbi:sulfhydryl oxidase 1 isoform X2 [Anabrus simplex]